MAVTITRSIWIDDDGTGTTGTVINQALHTTLYNEIDTALAKVAQLAGGNTFTGAQAITGNQSINGQVFVHSGVATALTARVQIISNQAAQWGLAIQSQADIVSGLFIGFVNAAGAQQGYINALSPTTVNYATTSDARLKRDRGRAEDLTALRAVTVHEFEWIADGVRDRGVFAQEAHVCYPRAVSPGTDETTDAGSLARPWMTDYSKFVPDLIVGWQQHDADLAELRAILAAVKG